MVASSTSEDNMTNTQRARLTLQDPLATAADKRAALQVLQDCFAAKYRVYDTVQTVRQQLMIGRVA